MSKQKRFTKQSEIEAEIIIQKRRMEVFIDKAVGLESASDRQFQLSKNQKLNGGERAFYQENSRELLFAAEKLRRRALFIETEKLKVLKEALAEFKTKPFPFMGDDEGVVLHE
jgi:hypothetical protein